MFDKTLTLATMACSSCLSTSSSPNNFPCLTVPPLNLFKARNITSWNKSTRPVHCLETIHASNPMVERRRSASYHPNIWDFDFIESLNSDYKGELCERQSKKHEERVRHMLSNDHGGEEELAQLQLIENLQRLGIGYIFENEIKRMLDTIATRNNNHGNIFIEDDLHLVALRFRLFRQHGYQVSPQDAFNVFKDNNDGCFKESLCEDIEGMLSFYEASHFALEGENILDEAKVFTTKYLKEYIEGKRQLIDPELAKRVKHSLEIPLHWRMQRLEARWFTEACMEEDINHNIISLDLIELAKLNFNKVQGMQQEELKEFCRWWRKLGLASHLSFVRDGPVEDVLWSIGIILDPQYSSCRMEMAKAVAIITTIDDIYDNHGSLDELEQFTHSVERWDIDAMEGLPNYMKLCFLALYNTANETIYSILKEHGLDVSHCLKKLWAELCKAYLVEARWYNNKYTPSLKEYLDNAWVSVAGPITLFYAYLFLTQEKEMKALESFQRYPDIIRWSSIITRLWNDLGTSKDELRRGDVPKSVQCYMHETGVSKEVAREHIKHLISEGWKKMNKERLHNSVFSKIFIEATMNLARTAQFIYQCGDWYGVSKGENKNIVLALLVEPMLMA